MNEPEKIDEQIATLRMALDCRIDAHFVESIISLFNQGVLEHRLTSPRMKFDQQNTKMTIEQSSSVLFKGREKLIEMEREVQEKEDRLREEKAKVKILLRLIKSSHSYHIDYDMDCGDEDCLGCVMQKKLQREKGLAK